jgi:hypothetical protein
VRSCALSAESLTTSVLRYLFAWAILFVSKFVILEVVVFVTAGRAALGNFFEIVAIVVALMAAEAALAWVYKRLGNRPSGFSPGVTPRSNRR